MSHTAFHRAFEEAKPERAQVPGLQEFAAAIWARRRLIASNHDPLAQIFDEVGSLGEGQIGPLHAWRGGAQAGRPSATAPHVLPIALISQFDTDNDGILGCNEVTEALCSRGVPITNDQVGNLHGGQARSSCAWSCHMHGHSASASAPLSLSRSLSTRARMLHAGPVADRYLREGQDMRTALLHEHHLTKRVAQLCVQPDHFRPPCRGPRVQVRRGLH